MYRGDDSWGGGEPIQQFNDAGFIKCDFCEKFYPPDDLDDHVCIDLDLAD